MTVETLTDIKPKIIDLSADAQTDEDWEFINSEIESLTDLPDHNLAAETLLSYADDENPQVRDAVASSLVVLNISDEAVLKNALNKMILQATNRNEQIYSAGRAAVFLMKYQADFPETTSAIDTFKNHYFSPDLRNDLIENIPDLKSIFTN